MINDSFFDFSRIIKKCGLKEGMKVADFGCGARVVLLDHLLKAIGKNSAVFAIDVQKKAIDSLEKKKKIENLNNLFPVWSNLEVFNATKIEAGSIDIGFLINTLHQSGKRAEIIREVGRMLKKDGKMVIVEWKNSAIPFGPNVDLRVNKDSLIAGAMKLGFHLENEFEAGPYHYCVIFNKL